MLRTWKYNLKWDMTLEPWEARCGTQLILSNYELTLQIIQEVSFEGKWLNYNYVGCYMTAKSTLRHKQGQDAKPHNAQCKIFC